MTGPSLGLWLGIALCLILPTVLIAWLYLSTRTRQQGTRLLERQSLPQTTVAYIRLGYILTRLPLAIGLGLLLMLLVVELSEARSPYVLLIAPGALLAAAAALHLIHDLVFWTHASPWGKPAVRLSFDDVSFRDHWSVRWTEVSEVDFEASGGKYPTWYMRLRVKAMPAGARRDWLFFLDRNRGPTLRINVTATTLPLWQYEVLAKRYWCEATGVAYVPVPPELL